MHAEPAERQYSFILSKDFSDKFNENTAVSFGHNVRIL